jgi:murein L,D-transpeptidase YcbB/YkuD
MYFRIFLATLVFLSLAGCATTKRSTTNLEIQQLQMKVKQLERETQQKDRKISDLEYELNRARVESRKVKEVKIYPETKAVKTTEKKKTNSQELSPRNIQAALKNAGFYNDSIDGKIGKATKKAIMEFQKANGLKPDGIVGDKTWARLSRYLD